MIPKDKVLHILAGALVSLAVLFAAPPFAIPTLCASAAGGLKEVYDYASNRWRERNGLTPNHNVEASDFWHTVAGGFGGEVFFRFIEAVFL